MKKLLEYFYGPLERPPEGWIYYIAFKFLYNVLFFSPAMVRAKWEMRRTLATAERTTGWLPLEFLELGHPVKFHPLDTRLARRVADVAVWAAQPYEGTARILSMADQRQLMGSATPIRVTKLGSKKFSVADGNGRTAVLKKVLGTSPLLLEVELLK